MVNEVNLTELYPLRPKHIVYKHDACGYIWIQRGYSSRVSSFCSKCHSVVRDGLVAYPTAEEAEGHRRYLQMRKEDEIYQTKVAKVLDRKIDALEDMIPKEKKYYNGIEVSPKFLDGSFYKKWLNWTNVSWPEPDVFGFNTWKNMVQTKSFGPPKNGKPVHREHSTAELLQNISDWSSK
uniref:Cytochrome c domain-containing protein n=1 Tax=Caenorhabditis tropicalis TaxID=1561998 RepID=A0A1I7UWR1_9PELO